MAVEINIDLDSGAASGKIETLRTELKSLNDDIDIDLNIDEDLKDQIQKITDDLGEINIDVDYDDLKKAAALKTMLQGDIDTKLNVKTNKALSEMQDNLDPPNTNIDHDKQARKFTNRHTRPSGFDGFRDFMNRYMSDGAVRGDDGRFTSRKSLFKDRQKLVSSLRDTFEDSSFSIKTESMLGDISDDRISRFQGRGGQSGLIEDQREMVREITSRFKESGSGGFDRDAFDYNSRGSRIRRFRERMKRRSDLDIKPTSGIKIGSDGDSDSGLSGLIPDLDTKDFKKVSRQIGSIKKGVVSAIPSMSAFYNIFAALIPILAVVAVQLLGVASAMGAVAVAGAAMIGMGLFGHGSNMSSSINQAKKEVSELGEEIYQVFQPAMQTFAPIQSEFFDFIPGQLGQISDELEGLTVYKDTIFDLFSGMADWTGDAVAGIADSEDKVSQLTKRFGSILGSGILKFFGWLLNETYRNQQMLIRLGSAFASIAYAVYNFFEIIVRVISIFSPLAGVLAWVSKMLNNKVVVAILAFVAAAGLAIYGTMALTTAFTGLIGMVPGLITGLFGLHGTMTMYIHQALATVMANHALASSIASVISVATLGIAAIAGLGAAMSAVNGMNATADVKKQMNHTGDLSGGPSGGYGGGSSDTYIQEGDTYNVEVHGNLDNASEEGLRDTGREYPGGN